MKSGGLAAGAGWRAEEIEWDCAAVDDEARKKAAGLVGVCEGRGGVGGAEDRFDEGWSWGRKLCGARREEDQAGGVEPVAEHVDGEDGIGVV